MENEALHNPVQFDGSNKNEPTVNVGTSWNRVDPKEILGMKYSSGSGYRQILNQVTTPVQKSGGGCGV